MPQPLKILQCLKSHRRITAFDQGLAVRCLRRDRSGELANSPEDYRQMTVSRQFGVQDKAVAAGALSFAPSAICKLLNDVR
jgi:hypothetical protein